MGRNDTNFLVTKDPVPPTLNPSERTLWFWRSFPTTRNTRQQHSLSPFRPEKQRHKSKASMTLSFWSCHRVKSLGMLYQSSSIHNSIHTVVSNSAKFYPDVVFRKYTISTLFLWDLEVATGMSRDGYIWQTTFTAGLSIQNEEWEISLLSFYFPNEKDLFSIDLCLFWTKEIHNWLLSYTICHLYNLHVRTFYSHMRRASISGVRKTKT